MIFGKNTKSIKATIFYTVDAGHPDIEYIKEPEAEQSFTDTYTFDVDYYGADMLTMENMKAYAKRDLKLVAGGRYDADHIHNVRFEFSRV